MGQGTWINAVRGYCADCNYCRHRLSAVVGRKFCVTELMAMVLQRTDEHLVASEARASMVWPMNRHPDEGRPPGLVGRCPKPPSRWSRRQSQRSYPSSLPQHPAPEGSIRPAHNMATDPAFSVLTKPPTSSGRTSGLLRSGS